MDDKRPSAWCAKPEDLGVRSIALPRDGGLRNDKRKFDLTKTDVAATFARERRRLKQEAAA